MKKLFEKAAKNLWFRIIGTIIFTVIPAFDFYRDIVLSILGKIHFDSIDIASNFIDIITGLMLGGIFLLFLRSKNEYTRIKQENRRMREMFLTIHIFNNIRFTKLSNNSPTLFQNEEQNLKRILPGVFKHDLGKEYSTEEINELLDCFYRDKPKFQ